MLNFVITAGGTIEPIDHVREIRNTSTGATGKALAEELKRRCEAEGISYHLHYVAGREALVPPPDDNMTLYTVGSVQELVQAARHLLLNMDIRCFIHAMAVSDFKPGKVLPLKEVAADPSLLEGPDRTQVPSKIDSGEPMVMTLVPTPKVIGMVKELSPETLLVGFKLLSGVSEETLIDTARRMAATNGCSYVLANDMLQIDGKGHKGILLSADDTVGVYGTKEAIAEGIIDTVLKEVAR